MWSPDMMRAGWIAVALAAVGLVVSGCNVRPLYGSAVEQENVVSQLAFVDVAPVKGRVGQQLRNDLLFLLHGAGSPGDGYVVSLDPRTTTSAMIVRRVSGQPRGVTLTLLVGYELRRSSDDAVVMQDRVIRHAAIEWSEQRFANERAEMDAENRAAREAAEEIRMRLAAFFAGGGRQRTDRPGLPDMELPDFETDDEEIW